MSHRPAAARVCGDRSEKAREVAREVARGMESCGVGVGKQGVRNCSKSRDENLKKNGEGIVFGPFKTSIFVKFSFRSKKTPSRDQNHRFLLELASFFRANWLFNAPSHLARASSLRAQKR